MNNEKKITITTTPTTEQWIYHYLDGKIDENYLDNNGKKWTTKKMANNFKVNSITVFTVDKHTIIDDNDDTGGFFINESKKQNKTKQEFFSINQLFENVKRKRKKHSAC